MNKMALVALVSGGCAVGTWLLVRSNSTDTGASAPTVESSRTSTKTPDDVALLSKELKRLEQSVARLSNGVQRNAAQMDLISAPPAASHAVPVDDPADQEDAAAVREQQLMSLQERLRSEPADPSWSVNAENDIRAAVRTNLAGSTLLSTRCVTTVCQAVVQHEAAPESQMSIVTAITSLPLFRAGVVYDFNLDAKPPTTTLWVLRDQKTVAAL